MISQISNNSLENRFLERFVEKSMESKSKVDDLTDEEKQQVQELKARDREVKQHELAHMAGGSGIISSGPSYQYQRGPDGIQYAVGGEVHIDTTIIPDDPEATLRKMQQVQAAANAPSNPSTQDRKVASQAAQAQANARIELAHQKQEQFKQGDEVFSTYFKEYQDAIVNYLM